MTTNTFIVTLNDDTTAEQLEHHLDNTESVTAVEPKHSPDLRELGPCPECGHEQISVMQPAEELWETHENGYTEYREHGHATGPVLNIMCTNCTHVYYQHPVDTLVNYS